MSRFESRIDRGHERCPPRPAETGHGSCLAGEGRDPANHVIDDRAGAEQQSADQDNGAKVLETREHPSLPLGQYQQMRLLNVPLMAKDKAQLRN